MVVEGDLVAAVVRVVPSRRQGPRAETPPTVRAEAAGAAEVVRLLPEEIGPVGLVVFLPAGTLSG